MDACMHACIFPWNNAVLAARSMRDISDMTMMQGSRRGSSCGSRGCGICWSWRRRSAWAGGCTITTSAASTWRSGPTGWRASAATTSTPSGPSSTTRSSSGPSTPTSTASSAASTRRSTYYIYIAVVFVYDERTRTYMHAHLETAMHACTPRRPDPDRCVRVQQKKKIFKKHSKLLLLSAVVKTCKR